MVLVFPGTGSGFNGLELAEAHELLFSGLGQEFTPASFADDNINASCQLLGNNDVSSFCVHGSSPPAISKSRFEFNKKWEYVNERRAFGHEPPLRLARKLPIPSQPFLPVGFWKEKSHTVFPPHAN
jgi:hypothetical protein